jgi:thiol-disulfide isomerase/thioredoxin
MLFRAKYVAVMGVLLLAAVAGLLAWPVVATAQEKPPQKSEDKPAQKTTEEPAQNAAEEPKAEAPDPYAVPEGTTADLAKFIEKILSSRPKTREEFTKGSEAMGKAADKILAGKASDEELQLAVQVKTMFASSAEELEALAAKLKDAGKPKLARQVVGRALQRKLFTAARASTEDLKKVIEEVKKHVSEAPLEPSDVSLVMAAGQAAEYSGDDGLAVDTYTTFGKMLAASKDEAIAERGKTMEGVVRRLTLVGKPMEVEGTILGGDKFDWEKFHQGKVVLVDFWATWCPPCVREVPNVKEQYEKYHDKGFDIVGLSLDHSREALEKFLKEKEIPWTILYNDEARSPTIAYYGVMAIPTMILVDKDGNVVSIKARGEELDKELEKLLGPVEQKEKQEAEKEKQQPEKNEKPDTKS